MALARVEGYAGSWGMTATAGRTNLVNPEIQGLLFRQCRPSGRACEIITRLTGVELPRRLSTHPERDADLLPGRAVRPGRLDGSATETLKLALPQHQLAQRLMRVCRQGAGVDLGHAVMPEKIETALALSEALGTSPALSLNLQTNFRLFEQACARPPIGRFDTGRPSRSPAQLAPPCRGPWQGLAAEHR